MGHDINIMFLSALYVKLRWVAIFATPLAVRVTKIGLALRGLRFLKQSLHRRTGLQHCVGYSHHTIIVDICTRTCGVNVSFSHYHCGSYFAKFSSYRHIRVRLFFCRQSIAELYIHIMRVSICFRSFIDIISMVNRINVNFAQCVRARLLDCSLLQLLRHVH